ncbi:MAG: hypothetical protein IKB56_04540 [Clostridia bacterium]|nr:hypothetical protein [Clostridia bacterium]
MDNQTATITEQPALLPDKVNENTAIDKEESDSYGKFKTALELKNAYEKLEQEFTRKSQRLKELENQLNERRENDKWAEKVKALHQKYPVSKNLGEEITNYIKENKGLMEREDCLESALLQVLAKRYESERMGARVTRKADNVPHVISGGAVSVTPHAKPLTVKEANALATERLKKITSDPKGV